MTKLLAWLAHANHVRELDDAGQSRALDLLSIGFPCPEEEEEGPKFQPTDQPLFTHSSVISLWMTR